MYRLKQRAILYTVLSILAGVGLVNGLVSNACYGTDPDCDFYTIRCEHPNIIKLQNLYAGYKSDAVCHNLTQHCDSFDTCCKMNIADPNSKLTLENTYNTYTNCSGRQYCERIHAPWQLLNNGKPSTYVQMEYLCEPATEKLPMCAGGSTRSYQNIDIVFNGSIEAFNTEQASKECKCTISNAGPEQSLIYTVIDIRMESYYKAANEVSAECSSAIFTSEPFSASCIQSNSHYQHNFFYGIQSEITLPEGGSTEIRLRDIHKHRSQTDSPSMVWVNIKTSDNNRLFTVNCEEVLPADLTTTTTSTTSTTVTTTTPTTTTTTPTTTTTTPTTTTTTTTTPTTTTTTPTTTTTTPTTTTTTPPPTTTTLTTTTTTPTTTTKPPTTTTSTTTPKTTTTTPTTTTTTPTTTTTTKRTTTTTTPTSTTKIVPTTPRPTTTTEKITTTTTSRTTTSTIKTTTSQSTTDSTPVLIDPTEGSKTGGGEKADKQRMEVYIAIFVPIAVGLLVIVIFLLWVYWKRTTPIKDKFHLSKYHPGSDVYKTLSDDKILDKFIHQQGVRSSAPSVISSTVKLPLNARSVVSVPSIRPSGVNAADYEKKITERYVPMEGSTYSRGKSPIQPYTIPIHGTKQNPIYSAPVKPIKQQPPTVYHVKLGSHYSSNLGEPKSNISEESVVKQNEKKDFDNVDPPPANHIDKPSPNEGVFIHVDNLSIPPDSARFNTLPSPPSPKLSSSPASTSTQSLAGSTARTSSVEDQPTVTSTENAEDMNGVTIHDATTPEDDGTIFVRF